MEAYYILQAESQSELQKRVNELATKGYAPIGGISELMATEYYFCSQAMYKPPAKKPSKPRASKKHEYDADFEGVYSNYPKVPGANKAKTYSAYKARLNEADTAGNDWSSMQIHGWMLSVRAAVIRYGELCKATDRRVMLPQTFFGPDKHFDCDWTIPTQPDYLPRNNDELSSWAGGKGYRGAYSGESSTDYRRALTILHKAKQEQ